MTYKITLNPSGHEFELEGKETILRAGLRSGLNLAHYCMNGTCGECCARLLEGKIKHCRHHDFRLSEQQKKEQFFLTCCCQPGSDLVLEMPEQNDAQEIPFQEIAAKVSSIKPFSGYVMELHLRTPRSKVLDFLSGQSVVLEFNGMQYEAGLSSCPCDGMNLRFHIPKDDSVFSKNLYDGNIEKNSQVMVKGPSGQFTLNEESTKNLVFLAWETGFSQVQSMIDHAISVDEDRHIQLFWLAGHQIGHYHLNYCRAWEDVLDHFNFVNLLVDDETEDTVVSVMNLIASQVSADSDYEIYSVLPERFFQPLKQQLQAKNFPMEQLFYNT
jgi:CDP-4-dehydro-6-deoxyglucose reductase